MYPDLSRFFQIYPDLSRFIQTYKSQITLWYLTYIKTHLLIGIVRLMGSVMIWPKVILLSGVHCIMNDILYTTLKYDSKIFDNFSDLNAPFPCVHPWPSLLHENCLFASLTLKASKPRCTQGGGWGGGRGRVNIVPPLGKFQTTCY